MRRKRPVGPTPLPPATEISFRTERLPRHSTSTFLAAAPTPTDLSPPPNTSTNPARKRDSASRTARAPEGAGSVLSSRPTRPNTAPPPHAAGPPEKPRTRRRRGMHLRRATTGRRPPARSEQTPVSTTLWCQREKGVPGREGGVQGGRGEGAAGDAGKGCVILRAWQPEPRSGGQRSRMARGSERSSGRRGRARERRPELEERTGGGRRARSTTAPRLGPAGTFRGALGNPAG